MQQTTTHIPDELQQAINEIYLWVKAGCPEHKYLDTCAGICSNVCWISSYGSIEVSELLFGDNEYPFDGDWFSYNACTNKYTNQKRLAWLKEYQTVE